MFRNTPEVLYPNRPEQESGNSYYTYLRDGRTQHIDKHMYPPKLILRVRPKVQTNDGDEMAEPNLLQLQIPHLPRPCKALLHTQLFPYQAHRAPAPALARTGRLLLRDLLPGQQPKLLNVF